MARLQPDPTFYPSPRLAMQAPQEQLAYVTTINPSGTGRPDPLCVPDGIYFSALGTPNGDGPGGIFTMDHESFDVLGRWEVDRGPQYLAYDFWWHLGYDTLITSEWGTPNMVEGGVNPELFGKYGR